jgi:ATP-dependent Clp protease protease subunit
MPAPGEEGEEMRKPTPTKGTEAQMGEEVIPLVIESTSRGDRVSDIFSRLLKDRIIFLREEISEKTATLVVAQLLYLELEDKNESVSIYIISRGGGVDETLAICDAMQHVSCPVATYCMGIAASGAACVLACGSKGMRYALPSSRIMIHQPWGGMEGDTTSIQIQTKEFLRHKKVVEELLAKHTGQDIKRVRKDCDRDFFMGSSAAKRYGIIDHILAGKKS